MKRAEAQALLDSLNLSVKDLFLFTLYLCELMGGEYHDEDGERYGLDTDNDDNLRSW